MCGGGWLVPGLQLTSYGTQFLTRSYKEQDRLIWGSRQYWLRDNDPWNKNTDDLLHLTDDDNALMTPRAAQNKLPEARGNTWFALDAHQGLAQPRLLGEWPVAASDFQMQAPFLQAQSLLDITELEREMKTGLTA